VAYLSGESDTGMFGAIPTAAAQSGCRLMLLIIRALLQYHSYYGNNFTIECPSGFGQPMNFTRWPRIYPGDCPAYPKNDREATGYGGRKNSRKIHTADNILFYEYFHGDNGAGIGASHQTGWTGIVARMMHLFASTTSEQVLELGKKAGFVTMKK